MEITDSQLKELREISSKMDSLCDDLLFMGVFTEPDFRSCARDIDKLIEEIDGNTSRD